jgi:hypothetical protein
MKKISVSGLRFRSGAILPRPARIGRRRGLGNLDELR